MDSNASNLFFLLSVTALSSGCTEEPTGSGAATSADGESTAGGSTEATTASSNSSTAASESTGARPVDSTSTGAATSDATDSTTGRVSDSSGTTAATTGALVCREPLEVGEVSPGCVGYVQILDMCLGYDPLSERCIAYEETVCQYQVNYDGDLFGEGCRAAYEDLYACVSLLSCREFDAGGCERETSAQLAACSPAG